MLRRIHSIVLLFALLIGSAGTSYVQAEVYSGTCGAAGYEANVTWAVDTESGVLSISGTGAMRNYDAGSTSLPWYSYRASITSVNTATGITGGK